MASDSLVTAEFLQDLRQEVVEAAEADSLVLPAAFTQWAFLHLEGSGEFEEGVLADYTSRGVEVHGYAFNDERTHVDLIVSLYRTRADVETEEKAKVTAVVKRLRNFLEQSLGGLHDDLEESTAAFDLALELHAHRDELQQARLIVLTDGLVRSDVPKPKDVAGISVNVDVWDAERLFRLVTSGLGRESIRVDLEGWFGEGWQCVEAPKVADEDYSVYLTLVPGQALAEIYDVYGPRLLELNVRSFLQARGKVNKGIRKTLMEQPGRFLAYNNGITATASKVRLTTGDGGLLRIAEIEDLQIVNGGQTSASLHRALVKDKVALDDVLVMAKVTVVDDPKQLDELVPLVSRFSNSQNRVSEADFAANDRFHVRLEELSRTIWAPAADGGARQTRWFYERARGQYQDEIGRLRTPARRKSFRRDHPTVQKFTKTDVAKFENTWAQLPHLVSKGAQRNFLTFQVELESKNWPEPDEQYFRLLVAKGILFRRTEKLVSAESLGGYRANVVAYTLALINRWTSNRLDLEKVWSLQALPTELEGLISRTSKRVFDVIANPPGSQNVTEWAKKVACWEKVLGLDADLPDEMRRHLASTDQSKVKVSAEAAQSRRGSELVAQVAAVDPEALFALTAWAMHPNKVLSGVEREIITTVAMVTSGRDRPSQNQAKQADRVLQKAVAAGFDHPGLATYAP
jgi:hypothetical protein